MCLTALTSQTPLMLPCHLQLLWPCQGAERWLAHCPAVEKGPGQRRADRRACPAVRQRIEPAAVAAAHSRLLRLGCRDSQQAIKKAEELGLILTRPKFILPDCQWMPWSRGSNHPADTGHAETCQAWHVSYDDEKRVYFQPRRTEISPGVGAGARASAGAAEPGAGAIAGERALTRGASAALAGSGAPAWCARAAAGAVAAGAVAGCMAGAKAGAMTAAGAGAGACMKNCLSAMLYRFWCG